MGKRVLLAAGKIAVAAFLFAAAPPVQAEDAVAIRVVGGLAGVSQFNDFEEPFWLKEIPELSGGRLSATIAPFDKSGLRGQDMLNLVRLGVVPFGTVLAALASGDEPELNAVDLPVLSPDSATLEAVIAAYRSHLEALLRDRYGIELLGVYAYPAQVIYCADAFTSLRDLAGRRIRTSSVAQGEFVEGLGAVPVPTSFSEIRDAFRRNVVDCAITGTLSGAEIGLAAEATHLHDMAIGWGISFFVANGAAWKALPPDLRDVVADGVQGLEARIRAAANVETAEGLNCNTGAESCEPALRGAMTLVHTDEEDAGARRLILQTVVLPRWIARCGSPCAEAWNAALAPVTGIAARLQ